MEEEQREREIHFFNLILLKDDTIHQYINNIISLYENPPFNIASMFYT